MCVQTNAQLSLFPVSLLIRLIDLQVMGHNANRASACKQTQTGCNNGVPSTGNRPIYVTLKTDLHAYWSPPCKWAVIKSAVFGCLWSLRGRWYRGELQHTATTGLCFQMPGLIYKCTELMLIYWPINLRYIYIFIYFIYFFCARLVMGPL